MDQTIKCLWNVCSNEEYDNELWDLIFEEEGITPEEDDFSLDELEDELYDEVIS